MELGTQKDHWIINIIDHPLNDKETLLQTKYSPGRIKRLADKNAYPQEDEDYEPMYTEEWVVKYAKSKGDKIQVAKYKDEKQAREFLSDLKYNGYNGIVKQESVTMKESTWSKIQSVLLEAAIKPGKLELNDGSSINVSVSDSKLIDKMMKSVSKDKKSELEAEIKKNKKGFQSVLSFASEILNEALDDVNSKELKKNFKNRKDKDIDNDGEVDDEDEYLHNRRKAISKNMNELSQKTMDSYVKKSAKSFHDADQNTDNNTMVKRAIGMRKAFSKMKKSKE